MREVIPLPALKSSGSAGYGEHERNLPEVVFYYDIVCPYAYMAAVRLPALAERAGAVIDWRPILLGGVLNAIGSTPNAGPAQKVAMTLVDIARWADHYGIPLSMPKEHPRRTVEAMRLLCFTPPVARQALTLALYEAYWVKGLDITSPHVLAEVAESVGLSKEGSKMGLESPAAKLELRRRTEAAVEAGVFGVPTFVVEAIHGPRLFFGQDRMHFVEAALRAHPLAENPGSARLRKQPRESMSIAEPVANEAQRLTFYYDLSSPFSYLASTQIEEIAERHGAILEWRPILLGGLFRSLGTAAVPLHTYPESKQRHTKEDLQRWAHYFDQPFHFPSRFPMVTVSALRLLLLAGDKLVPLTHALFRAYWVEDADLNDPAVLKTALRRAGLSADLLDKIGDPEIKDRLRKNTEEAIAQGVFGAPSFLLHPHGAQGHEVGPQLFFGQDRLDLLEDALARGRTPPRLQTSFLKSQGRASNDQEEPSQK